MHSHGEESLEPLVRKLRFTNGSKYIEKGKPIILADLGCGPKIRFHSFANQKGIIFKKYYGIDPLLSKTLLSDVNQKNLVLIKNSLKTRLPLPDKSVDYVVGFAFLEHVDHPQKMLAESVRILKKGGKAIFTTPSFRGKKVLEFLSFKLGVISKREIMEHKNYFNKKTFQEMLSKVNHEHKSLHLTFELGMNNLLVIERIK